MKHLKTKLAVIGLAGMSLALVGCNEEKSAAAAAGVSPQKMADALFTVMEADRAVYTSKVIKRLVKEEKMIKASEHWKDDKALPLPAQMFRMASERAAEHSSDFSYSLISAWPINSQNEPKTAAEKEGVQFIEDNPGKRFYKEEELGGTTYFTAIYPDVAVSSACSTCHNEHKDSPKTDFKVGDTMGGVVIRIPL
jgi:hypothetical protein